MKEALIISYFYKPDKRVASLRTSYWAETFHLHKINTTVLTATIQEKSDAQIIHLAPSKRPLLNFIIKDLGINWINPLKKYFLQEKKKYDFIIITGGPFMHFILTKFLKRNCDSKVILDFRDPFANNYRFKSGVLKERIKKIFEKKSLRYADLALSVNHYILNSFSDNKTLTAVIPNGYDERQLSNIKKTNLHSKKCFSYAGKFYLGCSPTLFLNALVRLNIDTKLVYMGRDFDKIKRHSERLDIENLGELSYLDTLSQIFSSDIGLVFTEGKEFETLTKPFDYMACNKTILVITEGKTDSGALYDLLDNYPNKFWVKNNEDDILKIIPKVMNHKTTHFDASAFSRRNSTIKLAALLNEL